MSKILYAIPYGLNFAFMQLFLKIVIGMANSVDPDQAAPGGTV